MPATAEQLEQALRAADKAGNVEDARRLAQALQQTRSSSGPAGVVADVKNAASGIAIEGPAAVDRAAKIAKEATHTGIAKGEIEDKFASKIEGVGREGVNFGFASDLLSADTPEEKQRILQAHRPGATLGKDSLGREYVQTPDGKKEYVEPADTWSGMPKRMGEQIAARPGQTIGAVAGGALGAAIPGPPWTAMLGAGAGGELGTVIDELVKKSRGLYSKTPGQAVQSVGGAGVANMVGEGVARIPGKLLRGSIMPDFISGSTPETKEFGKELMDRGGQPAYTAGARGLKSVQWKTAAAEKYGLDLGSKNTQALLDSIETFLNKGGVSDVKGTVGATKSGDRVVLGDEARYGKVLVPKLVEQRAQLSKNLGAAESDLKSIEDFNAKARDRAQAKLSGVEQKASDTAVGDRRSLEDTQRAAKEGAKGDVAGAKSVLSTEQKAQKLAFDSKIAEEKLARDTALNKQMQVAKSEADRSLETLRTGLGRPAEDLQATVAEDIEKAKQSASAEFTSRYQSLDHMESGLVSNMAPVSRAAKNMLDSIPKGPDGKYLIPIDEVMAPKIAMLEQLSKAGSHEMSVGDMAALRTSLYQLGGARGLIPTTKQHLLTELYKSADEAVKGAIPSKGFGDGLLSPEEQAARLDKIQSVRASIEKDYAAYRKKFDDVLAQRLVKEAGTRGSVDAENVIGLASSSPNQFRRIWNIVTPETQRRISRGLFDDMIGKATSGGEIKAQAFVDQLMNNAKILKEVFGSDSKRIVEAANGLLAVDGKMPLNKKMMPSNVLDALKSATKTKQEMDKYFSKNSLALMAGEDETKNRAVQEAKLLVAKKREDLSALSRAQTEEKRGMEDKTLEEKRALAERIAEAGKRVSARGEQRIQVGQEKVTKAKEAVKDFDSDQFAKMADPKFLTDGAVDTIIRPGKPELLNKAVSLYGPGSPQVKALQEAFWRKAIASGTRDLTDAKRSFAGEGIRDFLKSYTKEQKDILLAPYATTVERVVNGKPKMINVSGEEGLQKLARYMDFAFPQSGGDVSAALATGATKSKVGFSPSGIAALAKMGKQVALGWLLNTKPGYKMLIQGFEYGPKGEAALAALDNSMRTYVQSSASNESLP